MIDSDEHLKETENDFELCNKEDCEKINEKELNSPKRKNEETNAKNVNSIKNIEDDISNNHNNNNNYQHLIDLEDINGETYWVISGKTRVGLQLER